MEEPKIKAPVAKTTEHTFEQHGRTFSDPYAWLQNKDDPQVIEYLVAENEYAQASLAHNKDLEEKLFVEMRGRIPEDDMSAPERRGDNYYYTRNVAGKQYGIFCRKSDSVDASEEILLDENILAEGKSYCKVFLFEPSPDQNLLAYGVDTTGARIYDLYIKDLRNGQIISGPIQNVGWSIAWASDNQTLFYTVFDSAHRPYKLFRHRLGTRNDVEIYHEADDAFPIYIRRSRSGDFIFLTSASATTTEVRFLRASEPQSDFAIVQPRQHWMEYYLEHHGDRFLVRTNDQAENYKVMEAPVSSPGKENWRELIPHRADTFVEEVDTFENHLVINERTNGLAQIRISAPDGLSNSYYVQFPEPVYTVRTGANPEFNTSDFRFFYSSMITPESTIDYEMNTKTWRVKKRQEIPSGYDQELYTTERLFSTAPDGTKVPVSLAYRKGLKLDGNNPLVLYGYGSYGFSSDANFDAKRFSLIDRGFIFAIAHVRGGSDLGRRWYEDGRLMNKKNTFNDFIACAEHLIKLGYTQSNKLAIMGASAGGLLVSAVTNMRPDLFKAVVALVPFTNVIVGMLMPDLPLTVIEWEQWGNPSDPTAFDYMLSYSPYENVAARAYPNVYAKAGLNDLQVPYWDPAKWVARLRANKTDQNTLIFVTNMGAGHGGASGRYDYLREVAQYYAFLIDKLN